MLNLVLVWYLLLVLVVHLVVSYIQLYLPVPFAEVQVYLSGIDLVGIRHIHHLQCRIILEHLLPVPILCISLTALMLLTLIPNPRPILFPLHPTTLPQQQQPQQIQPHRPKHPTQHYPDHLPLSGPLMQLTDYDLVGKKSVLV